MSFPTHNQYNLRYSNAVGKSEKIANEDQLSGDSKAFSTIFNE